MIEKDGVLHLAGVANDAVVSHDNVLPDIGVVANLAVPANDCGPCQVPVTGQSRVPRCTENPIGTLISSSADRM